MPTQVGLVRQQIGGKMAEVITDRKGGCGGCQPGHGCRGCLTGSNKLASLVRNPLHARPGDVVEIQIGGKALWGGAACFYILPMITMIIGAIAGNELVGTTAAVVWLAFGGLGASLLLVWWLYRKPSIQETLMPRISRIMTPAAASSTQPRKNNFPS